MSTSQTFIGMGLTFGLAIVCQIIAARFRLAAIIFLVPVAFAA